MLKNLWLTELVGMVTKLVGVVMCPVANSEKLAGIMQQAEKAAYKHKTRL